MRILAIGWSIAVLLALSAGAAQKQCSTLGVSLGMTREQIKARRGSPLEIARDYIFYRNNAGHEERYIFDDLHSTNLIYTWQIHWGNEKLQEGDSRNRIIKILGYPDNSSGSVWDYSTYNLKVSWKGDIVTGFVLGEHLNF